MPLPFKLLLRLFYKPTIASRFLIYILLISFFFTLAGTSIQLYIDYQSGLDQIEVQIRRLETSYIKSLTMGTWDMDKESVTLQLEGALEMEDIRYLEIKNELDILFAHAGSFPDEMQITRRFPLVYQHRGKASPIGTLKVVATMEDVYSRLVNRIMVILGTEAIKIFCMSAFIIFIFQTFITRHLRTMANYTGTIGLNNLEQPLVLNRKGYNRESDELDVVVNAFNEMRENLRKDIAQREKAEEALKTSEEKHRMLIELMNDGLITIDDQNKITFVNPKFAEMTGYQKKDLITLQLGRLFNEHNRAILNGELLKRKKGYNDSYEIEISAKNGEQVPVLISPQPLKDNEGNYAGSMAVLTDITARKQMEEELRHVRNYLDNIINSMPSIVVSVTSDHTVVHWNHEAAKRTGVAAEQARGKILSLVFPNLSSEVTRIDNAIATRQRQKNMKVSWHTDEGIRYVDILIYPLTANGVDGAVIRVDDITEKTRLEEIMVHAEKMSSVGTLAAGMAHEINNPLGAIMQSAQNIERRLSWDFKKNQTFADEAGVDLLRLKSYLEKRNILTYIHEIRKSGSRAAEIISNVLHFSRKSGTAKVKQDIIPLLDRAINLANSDYDLKKNYDFRHIDIVRDFEEGLPQVPCVYTEIEQVVLNLLRNAAQSLTDSESNDPARICIRARQDGDMVIIEVEDNGEGMSEETRRRIFDPFFTTKPVGQGTGLGLSVSYTIVTSNHNGRMEVESKPGMGTKFIVRLPV